MIQIVRSVLLLCLLSCLVSKAQAQTNKNLIAHYSFENCNALDVSKNNSDGVLKTDSICECGIENDAVVFDGIDDHLIFAGNILGSLRRNNFTLSFYIRPQIGFGSMALFSKQVGCSGPGFSMRLGKQQLAVKFIGADGEEVNLNGALPEDFCWLHVVLIKNENKFALYADGQEIAKAQSSGILDITNDANLRFGISECVNSSNLDAPFRGVLDEVRMYNRVLIDNEFVGLRQTFDRVFPRDTLIYEGGSVNMKLSQSCARSFRWTPTDGVAEVDSAFTTIGPDESKTYYLEMDYPQCTQLDSVHIRVIKPGDVDCENLPMAKAFTPNDDGLNDSYLISSPFAIQEFEQFDIVDRWGNVIFRGSDVNAKWDGYFRGKKMPAGVYLYRIKYSCNGERKVQTGKFMLLR